MVYLNAFDTVCVRDLVYSRVTDLAYSNVKEELVMLSFKTLVRTIICPIIFKTNSNKT